MDNYLKIYSEKSPFLRFTVSPILKSKGGNINEGDRG